MRKTSLCLTLLLIIGSSFHGILSTFLRFGLEQSENAYINLLIQGWKEGLIAILFLLALASKKRFTKIQILITAFIALGVIISLIQGVDFSHIIWGGRTEFSFLILLFALISLSKQWTKEDKKTLIKTFLYSGIAVVAFGLILSIIGHDKLTILGFRNDWSTFYPGEAPAFCQKEAGTDFCRLQSTFYSANRYAGFLLILIPLAWTQFKNSAAKLVIISAAVLSLALTLSTSGWLAGFFMLAIYIAYLNKKTIQKHKKFITTSTIMAISISIITAINFMPELKDSDAAHITQALDTIEAILSNPMGHGLAFSGPASSLFNAELLPENWFLQVTANLGILGLILFIWIWHETLKNLVKAKAVAALILIGILTQNLFIHAFEEPGLYVMLMCLIAISLKPQSTIAKKSQKE